MTSDKLAKLAYAGVVLLHIFLLHEAIATPFVFPDEIHYCVTGENMRWGAGYSMRGEFSATVPPLEPLFVALTDSLSDSPRMPFFILSVAIMCSALFPAYHLALCLNFQPIDALIYGVAVALLPHTFYAATYMSETLQYPLFFLALLLAIRWGQTTMLATSLQLGVLLGLMALNRYATATLLAVIILAVVLTVLTKAHFANAPRIETLRHLGLVVAVYALFQGGWWLYKTAQGVDFLGAYRTAASSLPYLSGDIVIAYAGDIFLAAGLITLVPSVLAIAVWIRELPHAGFLIATAVVIPVVTTALFDGGLTSLIRERLYIYW